tara:strand:+ start:1214 stop:1390 length:177 start_codon:yes stop_codon:yes gene_type:complete
MENQDFLREISNDKFTPARKNSKESELFEELPSVEEFVDKKNDSTPLFEYGGRTSPLG